MKRQHRRHHDGNDIVQDGEVIRVLLADSKHPRRSRHTLADDVRRLYGSIGHRPQPVLDALSATVTVHDCADLRRLIEARDSAFAALERRSRDAWKNGAAVNTVSPTDDPYDQQRPPRPPVGITNGNGDDDDNGDNGNGESRVDLNEAMDARARAYRAQYDQEKWRNPPSIYATTPTGNLSGHNSGALDPTTASAILAQGMRWRGGA